MIHDLNACGAKIGAEYDDFRHVESLRCRNVGELSGAHDLLVEFAKPCVAS